MESLSENKRYFKILIITILGTLVLALNGNEDLNYTFDLSFYNVPNDVRVTLKKNH